MQPRGFFASSRAVARFILKLSGTSRRTRRVCGSSVISLKTDKASYTRPPPHQADAINVQKRRRVGLLRLSGCGGIGSNALFQAPTKLIHRGTGVVCGHVRAPRLLIDAGIDQRLWPWLLPSHRRQ